MASHVYQTCHVTLATHVMWLVVVSKTSTTKNERNEGQLCRTLPCELFCRLMHVMSHVSHMSFRTYVTRRVTRRSAKKYESLCRTLPCELLRKLTHVMSRITPMSCNIRLIGVSRITMMGQVCDTYTHTHSTLIHTHTCTHIRIHTHTHTNTHTCTHIHTHTHTQLHSGVLLIRVKNAQLTPGDGLFGSESARCDPYVTVQVPYIVFPTFPHISAKPPFVSGREPLSLRLRLAIDFLALTLLAAIHMSLYKCPYILCPTFRIFPQKSPISVETTPYVVSVLTSPRLATGFCGSDSARCDSYVTVQVPYISAKEPYILGRVSYMFMQKSVALTTSFLDLTLLNAIPQLHSVCRILPQKKLLQEMT